MNKGKKAGTVIMLLGVLFILASGALLVFNSVTEKRAGELSADVLLKLDMDSIVAEPRDELTPPDYIVNPEMDMPEKEVDGRYYVGTVSIPALDITLPVMNECNDANLKISPCVYEGTPYKNNLIIAGHNYRKHFGSLRVEPGDKVIFKDMDGNEFSYTVMYTEIIDEKAVEDMSGGQWDLTLFTCTYSRTTRITVRCMLE